MSYNHKCRDKISVSNIYIVIPSQLQSKYNITNKSELSINVRHSCCDRTYSIPDQTSKEYENNPLKYIANWQIPEYEYRNKESEYDPPIFINTCEPNNVCGVWRTNFKESYIIGECFEIKVYKLSITKDEIYTSWLYSDSDIYPLEWQRSHKALSIHEYSTDSIHFVCPITNMILGKRDDE